MLRFHLLGPVGIMTRPNVGSSIAKPQIRALLVALLRDPGQHVPFDRLAEHLWTTPPASARANMRTHIATLRKALDACAPGLGRRIETRRAGSDGASAYRLVVTPEQVDAYRFTDLTAQGQHHLATGQPLAAVQDLTTALDLWRGPVGEDLPNTLPLRSWATLLTERRLTATEDLAQARLILGDHTGLVARLRDHATENPLRERATALLMQALHATDDRPGAVAAYQQHRIRLADELGMRPSAHLRELYQALLREAPPSGTQAHPGQLTPPSLGDRPVSTAGAPG